MTKSKEGVGMEILVSKLDLHLLKKNWIIGQNGYVYLGGGRTSGKQVLMHRIVMRAKIGEVVHHKNHNRLDNRRSNLQRINPSEHAKLHSPEIILRNRSRRIHTIFADCVFCRKRFRKSDKSRGTQRFCTTSCGSKMNYPTKYGFNKGLSK